MDAGKVVEIIGAVVDVQFMRQAIPKVYDDFEDLCLSKLSFLHLWDP